MLQKRHSTIWMAHFTLYIAIVVEGSSTVRILHKGLSIALQGLFWSMICTMLVASFN
jgi:hypothetical protein